MQPMRTRRRLGGGLVAVVAVLALAGCADAQPSVVAYVGNDRITQGQFDRAVAGVSSTLQEGQQVSRDAVVNALIHGALAEQIAATRNIQVTDSERDEFLQSTDLAVLLNDPDARDLAYDVADQQLVSEEVGAEAYVAAVRDSSVTLNPRFGVLDPAQKLITSVEQTGSLSEPAPLATPNP
jgi:parvulin-like peptidyl-prolyl isomerase